MRITKVILFFLLPGILLLQTCKKVEKEMLVSTGTVSNILTTTADVSGKILDLGQGATQYGHCYSKTSDPKVAGTKTEHSSPSLGDFSSTLEGLEPGTKYYVKAYLSRGNNVVYGNEINFTTASATLPELTTATISSITKTSAVGGGNITSEGGTPVTARGICWSLATNPTITNSKTSDGTGIGSFTSNLMSLTAGIKYYVRSYATNNGGTAYGNEVSFTTTSDTPVSPTITTASVSSITSSSAVCGGEVTNEGSASVTARGICWSTLVSPTVINSKTIDGNGLGSFVSNLAGLLPGTTYYVRAYATNSAGTGYGDERNFPTNTVIPTLTTVQITLVTATTASSGGNITSDGGASVTARGVCWSINVNPTVANNTTIDGVGTGIYSSNLIGLTPGTTYHVRAYATNFAGTAYGADVTFSTGIVLPTITTTIISAVTATTAISGGNIISDGGATVTMRGVCWSTNINPTTIDSKTNDGPGVGPFTSSIIDLTSGTTYHVRAYATNYAGTAYGTDVSFTTLGIPSITTTAISSITSTTASSGGNIIFDGGSTVTIHGVCWSISANPTTSNSKTNDGAGSGSFISNIAGLIPGTTYHVRAYATNSVGTAYGTDIPFTTSAVLPTVTTTAISALTPTTASSGGNVTSDGGDAVTAKGVCWNTSANPTTANSLTADGSGTGSYVSNLTGLTSNTNYYARAYATNGGGTSYGDQQVFTTLATVTTTTISNITSTNASGGGYITVGGGSSITVRGVCWSTSPDPTITSNKTTDASGSGSFTSILTGLISNTIYFVRAYATNGGGTSYGDQQTFTTLASITTTTISNITITTASGGGDIASGGGANITSRGICWGISFNPTIANSKTTDGIGPGSFTSSLTGLITNTTYYVRAYANNAGGTSYGDQQSFASLASVTTAAISNIAATFASSGGYIDVGGGASILASGVCWSTSPEPTTANSKTTDGTSTGNFTSNLTGLTSNTTYYVRAYATNGGGTLYGNQQTFTTLASVTTTVISNITTTNASGGGSISTGGGANITAKGVCWSTTTNPTITDNKTIDGGGTGSFISSITGLIPCITYHVRAYATNSGGTAYGEDVVFSAGAVLPTVTTTAISAITSTSAISGGNITGDCGSSVTARGVCWNSSPNPTVTGFHSTDGTGTGTFTSSITGLTLGSTYYVRAYATNMVGTTYGNQISFTTVLAIGDSYQGGKIAYILVSGDPGYISGQTHGIIAASSDQSTAATTWWNGTNYTTGATGTALGTGQSNTTTIIQIQGNTGSYAAKLCQDLILNGYTDWYLPSKDELLKLYFNRVAIGGFPYYGHYWSSTETSSSTAAGFDISGYPENTLYKYNTLSVRAVRSF